MASFNLTINVPDNRVADLLSALDAMHPRDEKDENGVVLPHNAASAKDWAEAATVRELRNVYRRWKVRLARAENLGIDG